MTEKFLTKISDSIFYLFIFLLPWQTVYLLREIFFNKEKFQYSTIGIYLFEIILFIWIILNLNKITKCTEKKISLFLAIFIFWLFLSIFWSSDKIIASYFFICNLLGAVLFLILQSSVLNFKKFSFTLISSISISALLGLYQFFTQSTFSNKWLGLSQHLAWQGGTSVLENDSFRVLRAYGSLPHPNILGGFLVIALLLSLGAYLKSSRAEIRWKIFLIITIPINFLALLTTFSRSAILAFIIGTILISVYFIFIQKIKKSKDLLCIFYAILILSSIFFVAFSDIIYSRTSIDSRLEKKSLNERVLYIKDAKKIISQKPLTGTGIGNYTFFVLKNKATAREIWNIHPVHNIYLLVFAEIGFLGFSFFALIITFILWELHQSLKESNNNRVIFSCILISLLTLSLFDHWLWTTPVGILIFWTILGFSREKYFNYI